MFMNIKPAKINAMTINIINPMTTPPYLLQISHSVLSFEFTIIPL